MRETNTLECAAAGVDGGVDADYFAGHIDERAAGISGIDGGVGLNEALELVADVGAIFRANDSGGDGGIQSEGAAKGQDPIADLYTVGIAELSSGEFVVGVNFDDGEIGVFVDADYVGVVMSGIAIDGDLNFCGLVNDVIVGEDETFFVNDYSGAEAAFSVLAAVGRIEEAVEEILEDHLARSGAWPPLGFSITWVVEIFTTDGAELLGNRSESIGERDGVRNGEQRGAGGPV